MSMHYKKDTDVLSIMVGSSLGASYKYEAGHFSAYVDDEDALIEVIIKDASQFVAQAIAAGVEVKEMPGTTVDE